MTIRFSVSANTSASINPSAFVGLVSSLSAGFLPSAFANLIYPPFASLVSFPSTTSLMLIRQDMTKPFYIRKLVTGVDNIIALMNTKETLWFGGIPFFS